MSRYRRMRRGRVTQVQGIASRGEDFFLMAADGCGFLVKFIIISQLKPFHHV